MEIKCMGNVCRPFILFNDFLPPVAEAHKEWQYMSFGQYDGISVGENLFEKKCDLANLWTYYVSHGRKMDGSFSSRILWGFRYESCDLKHGADCKEDCCGKCKNKCADKAFWEREEKKKYPFLFVSLLQIEKTTNLSLEERKKLEQELTKPAVRRAITYLSLDNSDLILVLQCKSYDDGVHIINQFHYRKDGTVMSNEEWNLNYSFTVASIDKEFLSDNDNINTLNETIPYAYIYAIQKKPGGILDIREKIENSLGKARVDHNSAILGCNDEVLVIKDVPWCDFLKLFQDETGILSHTNKDYQKMLAGVTTIIGKEQDVVNKEEERSKRMSGDKSAQDKDAPEEDEKTEELLSEIIRKKCENIPSDGSVRMDAVKRGIYQVANSLHKFETSPFKDYLFQTVLLPLNMVVDMREDIVESNKYLSLEDYYPSFYEFMKGINLYAQNTGHTDRQFMQTPDMNIRIYDTPVKLNAFYNAFIYYFKQYMNSLDATRTESDVHEYEFLACPGVTNNMQVQELFKQASKKKRLFLVEMPESQIYNPKMMMVMLAHEVSHFVGTNIRMRDKRLDYVEKIVGKMITKYFRLKVKMFILERKEYLENPDLGDVESEFIQGNEYWNEVEENIAKEVKSLVDGYESYLNREKFKDMSEDDKISLSSMLENRKNHSEMLHMYMTDATAYVLENKDKQWWRHLVEKDFLYWLGKNSKNAIDKREELMEKIRDISGDFLFYDLRTPNILSISSAVDKIVYILKECFADLMAIMTLELTMAEYLNVILQCNQERGVNMTSGITGLDIRASLVTCCMCYDQPSIGYTWKKSDLQRISESRNTGLQIFRTKILNFKADYLDEGANKRYEDKKHNLDKAIDMLEDVDILAVVMQYLLSCKRNFVETNNEPSANLQGKLAKIYHCLTEENVEKLILEIQRYIMGYLEDIKVRNKEYAKGCAKQWK